MNTTLDENTLIDVRNLSKKYCRSLRYSMLYGLADLKAELLGQNRSLILRRNEFIALDDITFTLKRGECLGIIGANGSGKSTLLKLLTGILRPDAGCIVIKGNYCAIIELGAGFNPVLSGEENALINCQILGMSEEQARSKLDEIFDFAELQEFRHSPVSFYSSGMHVRLGFAIASQVQPDILILDEILAVGDAAFKIKSYETIGKMFRNTAVIIVSHDMTNIIRLSSKVLLLQNGKMKLFDDPVMAVDYYMKDRTIEIKDANIKHDTDRASIKKVLINGSSVNPICKSDEPMEIEFYVEFRDSIDACVIFLNILSKGKSPIADVTNLDTGFSVSNSKLHAKFITPNLTVAPGRYTMSISVYTRDGIELLAWHKDILPFTVEGRDLRRSPITLLGDWIAVN